MLADKGQLTIVFHNLIGNALKYKRQQPKVHIAAEKPQNMWLIKTQDNGIGFDQEYAEKIFELFTSLDSKVRMSSSGIGLAICSSIIENHGGSIWAEGKSGEGATFFFTLPQ